MGKEEEEAEEKRRWAGWRGGGEEEGRWAMEQPLGKQIHTH